MPWRKKNKDRETFKGVFSNKQNPGQDQRKSEEITVHRACATNNPMVKVAHLDKIYTAKKKSKLHTEQQHELRGMPGVLPVLAVELQTRRPSGCWTVNITDLMTAKGIDEFLHPSHPRKRCISRSAMLVRIMHQNFERFTRQEVEQATKPGAICLRGELKASPKCHF